MLPALFEDGLGLPLFGYISFRAAFAALTAFALALWWGKPVIAWLRQHKVRDGLKGDLAELDSMTAQGGKQNTPTMGGSFLVAALLVSVLLWCRLDNLHVVLAILLTAGDRKSVV